MNRRLAAEVVAIGLLLATSALVLAQSWQRWLDPIIDAGRDLYIPEQLLRGALLYGDVRYVYPPLTPYLLAAITSLTGGSLTSFTAIGITTAMATAAVIYLIARRYGRWEGAFAATLLFISCSLAGASTFGCNYIFPYAHAATLGMLMVLAACGCALAARPSLAVLFATAAAWMKLEMFLIATAIIVAAWAARRISSRALVSYGGALTATTLVARLIFGASLWRGLFPPSLLGGGSARLFYSMVSGADQWTANLSASAAGAVLVCAFVVMLALVDRMHGAVLMTMLLAGVAFVVYGLAGDSFFRAWTILQLALIPAAWKKRTTDPLLVLLVMSLASTSRVFFHPTPAWYGFVHVVPLYVLIAYIAFGWLPGRGVYSHRTALLWLIPVLVISVREIRFERAAYALKTFRVDTSRGSFFDANGDRAAVLNSALPLLRGRSLAVMPEGISINYLAMATTPLASYVFTPPEIGNVPATRAIIAELRERRPQSVALVSRDLREFGSRGFGLDYGQGIVQELHAGYEVERQWRTPRFTLVLLQLRSRR